MLKAKITNDKILKNDFYSDKQLLEMALNMLIKARNEIRESNYYSNWLNDNLTLECIRYRVTGELPNDSQ